MEKTDKIFNTLIEEKLVFLTGGAGVGKTHQTNLIIHKLFELGYRIGITASTGIASTRLNGQTLHSFLGIGISSNWEEIEKKVKSNSYWNWKFKRSLKKLDVLIIDEISMIDGEFFNGIEKLFREIVFDNKSEEPFGGLMVLLVGDFLQLEPVKVVKYIYETEIFKKFKIIQLNKIYRQGDKNFITLLKKIRNGEKVSNIKTGNNVGENPIILTARNDVANNHNEKRLNDIENESFEFTMEEIEGKKEDIDKFKKNLLVQEKVILKEGARVINLFNDYENSIVNGDIGEIISIKKGKVEVDFSGRIITLKPIEWVKKVYDMEGSEKTIASVKQIPLKLAYAITIHKSQGMTLSDVVIECDNIFASGQFYTALSRVKDLEHLTLKNFNKNIIKQNKKTVDFIREANLINL